jgi:hypothetical protein
MNVKHPHLKQMLFALHYPVVNGMNRTCASKINGEKGQELTSIIFEMV